MIEFYLFWIVWLSILSPLFMGLAIWFLIRGIVQKVEPVYSRNPIIVFVEAIICLLAIIVEGIRSMPESSMPVWVWIWGSFILFIGLFNILLYRAVILFIKITKMQNISEGRKAIMFTTERLEEIKKEKDNIEKMTEKNQILKNKIKSKVVDNAYKAIIIFSITTSILFTIFPIYVSISDKTIYSSFTNESSKITRNTGYVLGGYAALYFCALTFTGYKLRKMKDAFGIKIEIFLTAIIGVSFIIIMIIFEILFTNTRLVVFRLVRTILFQIMFIIFILINIIMPIYWSYDSAMIDDGYEDEEKNFQAITDYIAGIDSGDANNKYERCDQILLNDWAKPYFRTHLNMEFSSHHLDFWEDATRMLQACNYMLKSEKKGKDFLKDYENIIDFCITLHNVYISENNDTTINISNELSNKFLFLYHDLKIFKQSEKTGKEKDDFDHKSLFLDIIDVYTFCIRDVNKLLNGSFKRFKRTGIYSEMVEEYEKVNNVI